MFSVLILSTIVLGMSTHNGLADLLIGRTRGAILALLYGHADQSFGESEARLLSSLDPACISSTIIENS